MAAAIAIVVFRKKKKLSRCVPRTITEPLPIRGCMRAGVCVCVRACVRASLLACLRLQLLEVSRTVQSTRTRTHTTVHTVTSVHAPPAADQTARRGEEKGSTAQVVQKRNTWRDQRAARHNSLSPPHILQTSGFWFTELRVARSRGVLSGSPSLIGTLR